MTDEPGSASWPVTASTFVLMHKKPSDTGAAIAALKFFDWSFSKGDAMAEALDYVPMPPPVTALVRKEWSTDLTDAGGKPLAVD